MEILSEKYVNKLVKEDRMNDLSMIESLARKLDKMHTESIRTIVPERINTVIQTKRLTEAEENCLAKAAYILRKRG